MQQRATEESASRRRWLRTAGLGGGFLLGSASALAQGKKGAEESEEDVGPTEDLMREHGVLNRVLLIYDHFVERLTRNEPVSTEAVSGAATIVRKFVEEYHERQEEQFLFPRFRKAGVLTDLVPVLEAQHEAGRKVTARVLAEANARTAEDRGRLAHSLAQFTRMYRPHEAREDTVLFPALHKIVSRHEFDALGEQFEKNERKQFGGDGFEMYRDKVAAIEKQLGIYDLAQFTPKAP